MDNQPTNTGRPAALNSDPTNQTDRFADGRSVSDLTKNKGKGNDQAAYADDKTKNIPQTDEATEEDFKPFDLDKIDKDDQ